MSDNIMEHVSSPSRRRVLQLSGMALAAGFSSSSAAAATPDLIVSGAGMARIAGRSFRCAVGRGGVSTAKREGDGATPIGTWPLRQVLYRPDRGMRPVTALQTAPMKPTDGWCDAPTDPNYNRMVRHPYPASAEHLWRRDSIYDLVVVVGYNDAPVVPGKGSAIFLHIARPDYSPTAGCVAFSRRDLVTILGSLSPASRLVVSA
jgi:L,D-peptidoglycan transpeptidase YkuD (ErfK/YbiS/YcfS/YnhG family)